VNADVRTPTFPSQSYDLNVAVCGPTLVDQLYLSSQLYETLSHAFVDRTCASDLGERVETRSLAE
jgi:hypothetical protein